MGKFDDILLCTDLDDTLLTTDKRISRENQEAIAYFKQEGGLFTFATGRIPHGAKLMMDYVQPNVPIVCFNGAGIFDMHKEKMLWKATLDKEAVEVVEFIDRNFPASGIEVCTEDKVYFCKMNHIVYEHKQIERLPDCYLDYHEIEEPWLKVLFMQEKEQVDEVREALKNSEYAEKYTFIQSSPYYYELLPLNASKGAAAIELAKMLKVSPQRIIGVGDNENDLSLVSDSGVGIAVSNAVDAVKDVADYITVDNDSHAISTVVYALSNGIISLAG